jgi:hypothetical protein
MQVYQCEPYEPLSAAHLHSETVLVPVEKDKRVKKALTGLSKKIHILHLLNRRGCKNLICMKI